MNEQHHISRHSEEEEEDIESLRLAALKSLHSKATNIYHSTQALQRNIQVPTPSYGMANLSSGMSFVNSNNTKRCFYVKENIQSQRLLTNLADSYDTRQGLEKLDINEPYVPQHIAPVNVSDPLMTGANGWAPDSSSNGYLPYIPLKTNENVGLGVNNVQLSPRSLAFVAENNDILMRRKGENVSPNYVRSPCRSPCKSPSYRAPIISYRSPSPVYRQSPGRWSVTPPPKSNSRSPSLRNRPHYVHRRSMSRSLPPSRGRSPISRRRTLSRSPPLLTPSSRHVSPYLYSPRSPKYPSHKRVKSRSPPRSRKKTPPHRLSRSPVPQIRHNTKSKSPLNISGRRRSSPAVRHSNKIRPSPNHQKRSSSHGQDFGESRHSHRPRSPQSHVPNAGPSRSRSPMRKFSRRSRDRNVSSLQPVRRRSPYNTSRRRVENGYKNRVKKRSASPMLSSRRKFSRSNSPDKSRREDNRLRRPERNFRRLEESSRTFKGAQRERSDNNLRLIPSNGNLPQELKESSYAKENIEVKSLEVNQSSSDLIEDCQGKIENVENLPQKLEDDMFSEEANEADSSDESDDDGIDLFPSDESESENEGRFKLYTNKKERDESIPTLSFTKLGESSVPDLVKDLKDVGTASNGKSSNSGKGERGRDYNNYESRRRDDRFRKSDSNRSNRGDKRRMTGASGTNRREYEEPGKMDDIRRTERPMFKSTFQAVESDGVKGNGKEADEKDFNERKSLVQLKRKFHTKDVKDSPEKEISPEKLSSVVTSSSSSSGNSGTSGKKKPIHLRLGAMTNTFKAPKKSSTWSSSDKNIVVITAS